ncbi:MAG: tyrosine-type recombinase/integrase [Planctomycetota bacterium]
MAFGRALHTVGASAATRRIYCRWLERFLDFLGCDQYSGADPYLISDFLSHCEHVRQLGAASRRQALQALCAYYRLQLDFDPGPAVAAWREPLDRVPAAVPTPEAVARLLAALAQPWRLAAGLIYGSGLRPSECLALQLGQIDVARRRIVCPPVAGARCRRSVQVPQGLALPIERQLDMAARVGASATPGAGCWLFPDPDASGRHRSARSLQRAVAAAGRRACGLAVTPYDLRHACAVHLLAAGTDPVLVQACLGLRDRHAVCAYRRLLPAEGPQATSPFDRLPVPGEAAQEPCATSFLQSPRRPSGPAAKNQEPGRHDRPSQ